MKKTLTTLASGLVLMGMTGMAHASLATIGTATYLGSEYKLIWDNDNNGKSVIWLDYTKILGIPGSSNPSNPTGADHLLWAHGLDFELTHTPGWGYSIDPGYNVTWIDENWRLPSAIEGVYDWDTDGTTTAGYNITNSEWGHLFYEELGNTGAWSTDGAQNQYPSSPNYFLQNTGPFENLQAKQYWTGTTHHFEGNSHYLWSFNTYNGEQYYDNMFNQGGEAMAIREANVSTVPIPGAVWLLGSGLMGLIGLRRKK